MRVLNQILNNQYLRVVLFFSAGIAEPNIFGLEQQFHSFHQSRCVCEFAVFESAAPAKQPLDVGVDLSSAGIAVVGRIGSQLQPVDGPTGPQYVA